jgi:DNA-binding Xre family transcriptional regulator
MKKATKVKKLAKTKATLVKELEQGIGVSPGFFSSLERANAETIKRLTQLMS